MNKTFRLHRQHDMDLIALYRSDGFNFARELKKALIAYANGKEYVAPPFEDDFNKGYVATSVTFHISLSENNPEHKKVLDLLNDVKYGYRNSFVKAVFRSYLSPLPLSAFSEGNGLVTRRGSFSSPKPSLVTDAKTDDELPTAKESTKEEITTQEKPQQEDLIKEKTPSIDDSSSKEDMSSFMASLGALSHS